MYPRSLNVSANNALNAAPELFKPYNALVIIRYLPFKLPNSGPALVNIFSRHGAVKYAFWISHARISKSFKAAMVRAMRTLSLETTDAYVSNDGVFVVASCY